MLIERRDAIEVIEQQDGPNTLFYVDPPYPTSERTSVRYRGEEARGYRFNLSDDDHRRLAEVLRGARGMVVVSGYPCDLYDQDLYVGWARVERETLADGASPRTEVLWMNAACSARQSGVLDFGGPK